MGDITCRHCGAQLAWEDEASPPRWMSDADDVCIVASDVVTGRIIWFQHEPATE